jgi:hypothetical protein
MMNERSTLLAEQFKPPIKKPSFMKFYFLPVLFMAVVFIGCSNDDDVTPETPVPVLGPKLRSATTHLLGKNGFRPGDKSEYTYDEYGRLSLREYSTYDIVSKNFNLISVTRFTYALNTLTTMDELISGVQRQITHYSYTGGKLTKMVHNSNDITTEVTIQYLPGDTVQAFYQHTNGRSFTYVFHAPEGNIRYEKTINDSHALSSIVTNEFDGHVNPYSLLGYTDILFSNLSKSNKTKTESAYYTNYPNSVPTTYDYTYNDDGLPLVQTVVYKSYPNQNVETKMMVVFEY